MRWMANANQILEEDRLNELTEHFMQLHESDQYNRTEMEENDNVKKDNTINMQHKWKLNKQTYTESMDKILQGKIEEVIYMKKKQVQY